MIKASEAGGTSYSLYAEGTGAAITVDTGTNFQDDPILNNAFGTQGGVVTGTNLHVPNSPPTINSGSAGTATLTATSSDNHGLMTLTPISAATGALATVTFNTTRTYPPDVTISPVGAGPTIGGTAGVNVGVITTTYFTVNIPAALATTPFKLAYHVYP